MSAQVELNTDMSSVRAQTLSVTVKDVAIQAYQDTMDKIKDFVKKYLPEDKEKFLPDLSESFCRDFVAHMTKTACKTHPITENVLCYHMRQGTVNTIHEIAAKAGLKGLLKATDSFNASMLLTGYRSEPYKTLTHKTKNEKLFLLEHFRDEFEKVEFYDGDFDEEVMAALSDCTKLTSLSFAGIANFVHLEPVAKIPQQGVVLDNNFIQKIRSFAQSLTEHNPQLAKIEFIGSGSLAFFVAVQFAKYGHTLKEVIFNCGKNGVKLDDDALLVIAKGCPNLEVLNLGEGSRRADTCEFFITDKSVTFMVQHCPKLQQVSLCAVSQLSSASIFAFANGQQKLKSFTMVDFCNDSPLAIAELLRKHPEIEVLEIGGHQAYISKSAIIEILKAAALCPHLRSLKIDASSSLNALTVHEETLQIDYSDVVTSLRKGATIELQAEIIYQIDETEELECLQISFKDGARLHKVAMSCAKS